MPNFISWLLTVYGIAYTIAEKDIGVGVRQRAEKHALTRKLIACYFCLGFWVSNGLLVLYAGLHGCSFMDWILYAFMGATGSYFLHILRKLGERLLSIL